MKKITGILIFLFLGFLIFGEKTPGKKNDDAKQQPAISITDSFGRAITFDKPVTRIVSAAPSVTEIIFSLEKESLLMGRTDYCDYPAEAASVPSIGSITEPNIEKIVELDPDVVIASNHFRKDSVNKLESLSIKVLVLKEDRDFEGVYTAITDIAEITGAAERGNEIIAGMKKTVNEIEKAVAGKKRPSVYYVIGFGEYGDYTAGGNTFISQMITMAGGRNIAENIKGWSFSLESIVEADPDIIICSKYWNTKGKFVKANGYRDLRAVKEGRVYGIDNNLLDRQGPRLALGLKALAEIIHPECFY